MRLWVNVFLFLYFNFIIDKIREYDYVVLKMFYIGYFLYKVLNLIIIFVCVFFVI